MRRGKISNQIVMLIVLVVMVITAGCQSNTDFYKQFDRGRYPDAVKIMNETDDDELIKDYEEYVVKKLKYYFEEIQDIDVAFSKREENDIVALAQALSLYDLDVEKHGESEVIYLAVKAYATNVLIR